MTNDKTFIEEIFIQLDYDYRLEDDTEEKIRLFYSAIETNENRHIDFVVIENYDSLSLTFYAPEIIEFENSKRNDIINILNSFNSMSLYGAYFVRENSNFVSYRLGHSLEGELCSIDILQFQDYIGMLLYASDQIIDELGEPEDLLIDVQDETEDEIIDKLSVDSYV